MSFWKAFSTAGNVKQFKEQRTTPENYQETGEKKVIREAPQNTSKLVAENSILDEAFLIKESESSELKKSSSKDIVVLTKEEKFEKSLTSAVINLESLCKLSWNGIPPKYRSLTWKILTGYLPPHLDRRSETLLRKRSEYKTSLSTIFTTDNKSEDDEKTLHQINIDLPRTFFEIPLFHHENVHQLLRRVLYVWSVRHMASSYVQGIADILAVIVIVFFDEFQTIDFSKLESIEKLSFFDDENTMFAIEADSYWCLTRILDGIQDNYIFSQPGIQRTMFKIQELVQKIDNSVSSHLEEQNVPFLQFTFRWVNCLLIREIPLPFIIRMWDTYLSEGANGSNGFQILHTYVCVSLLLSFKSDVLSLNSPQLLLFLQNLPTKKWQLRDVEVILSQAYLYQTQYQNAPNHLKNQNTHQSNSPK